VPCEKVVETNELEFSNDSDVVVCVDSQHGSGINLEQLQVEGASIEVASDIASAALLDTDQQCNSSKAETMNSCSVTVDGQHRSSAIANNHSGCCKHSFTQISPSVSASAVGVGDCYKSSRSDSGSIMAGAARVSKSLSGTVKQSPIKLLPKPTYTLLPISSLLVVVNAGPAQLSGDRTQLSAIAPRPANVISDHARLPAVSVQDSSIAADCHEGGDILLQTSRQKSVSSAVTQTFSSPVQPFCKTSAVATQTSDQFAQASRLTKESRGSQVNEQNVFILSCIHWLDSNVKSTRSTVKYVHCSYLKIASSRIRCLPLIS